MKKLLFLLSLWLTALTVGAVPVTISGTITTLPGGAPVADQMVWAGDSLGLYFGETLTDADGHYAIILEMDDPTTPLMVFTFDPCFNAFQETVVATNNPAGGYTATVDFSMPECVPSDCIVWGTYTQLQGNEVQFSAYGYSQIDSAAQFTYTWDFGDGATGTGENPTHTYAQQGAYTVVVTATSPDCSATFTMLVEIVELQNITVSGNITYSNGAPAAFWPVDVFAEFNYGQAFTDGDGHYSLEMGVPTTATYVSISTYTFCDPVGSETIESLIINGSASADFVVCDSFPAPDPCYAYITYERTGEYTFQFDANTYSSTGSNFVTYEWNFGDGTTSNEANPEHTFAVSGIYDILLTATTADGCEAHACDVVFAFGDSVWCPIDTFFYGCQAMFYAGYQSDSIWTPGGGNFDPMTLTFYDASFGVVTSWTWNLGDGTTATGPSVTHTYAEEGVYTVTLSIVTVDGCESTLSMEVYAGEFPWIEPDCQALFLPVPDSTGNGYFFYDMSFSPGPIQSWAWDFGDGATSSEQNPYHVYAESGVYTVTLTITADSCNSMIQFEIDTDDPFNRFEGNGTFGLNPLVLAAGEPQSIAQARIAPNPVVDQINLAFESAEKQTVRLTVLSLTGQTVRTLELNAEKGANAFTIPSSDLTPGVYSLQMQGKKGLQTVKLVKM